MSLTLITPPAEEPVALDDLKAHLRITDAGDDAAIAGYGVAARQAIEARFGVALVAQAWRLTIDACPDGALDLPRRPVIAVDAVSVIDGQGLFRAVDPSRYETNDVRLVFRTAPRPARSVGGIRIDFTAGWPDAAAVPDPLKQAIRILTAVFYEHREGDEGRAERLSGAGLDALLAPYRRTRI